METTPHYGLFIGGQWEAPRAPMPVYHKFTGQVIAHVTKAERADIDRAVSAAVVALRQTPFPPNDRYQVLLRAAQLLGARKEEFARTLVREGGKVWKDAIGEAERAIETFTVSAEEAKRIAGEMVPVHGQAGAENRIAFTLRFPVGVVAAITPFNFPINLVAHKIGPALAAGNAVVLKPASSTPLCAILLCEILAEAGLPPGRLNLVTGGGSDVGEWLLDDPRINLYTFTGSTEIGHRIKARSGMRRTTLELGSNSATIVHCDADLDKAAELTAHRAFQNAGQMCISVQRVLVHESVAEPFLARMAAVTRSLRVGDPEDPATDVGPMISEREAARAEAWIREAVTAGARLVTGGTREGAVLTPTILTDVTREMKVVCQEVFAPIVTVQTYSTIEQAIAMANDSTYGLQAGVFTGSLDVALRCAREIEVGGVIINDTSAWRADLMPYGGVKESGIGREGPHYAIEEMTEMRLVVLNL